MLQENPFIPDDTMVMVDGRLMRYSDAPTGTAFFPCGGVGEVHGGSIGELIQPSGSVVIRPDGTKYIIPKR